MPDDERRLVSIELELESHAQDIRVLQEGMTVVQQTQGQHTRAIQELQSTSGEILSEVSTTRRELGGAMGHVADKLNEVSGTLDVWKATCTERHKGVDFRLGKVEHAAENRPDLDEMGDVTKNLYVRKLEGDIVQLQTEQERAGQLAEEERKRKQERTMGLLRLIGAAITALLTGGGGVLLMQWLLHK